MKLEAEGSGAEPVNWPSALDSYAQISSQVNTVMRLLKTDQMAFLKNLVTLPLLMSPEPDEELAKLTEGRVQTFNHEMVPNYLRTKPEPEIERSEAQIASKVAATNMDQGQKSIAMVNKIVTQVSDTVKGWKEELESSESGQRAGQTLTSSAQDTNTILAAITSGNGLKGPPLPDPKLLQQQQQQQQQAQQQQQPAKGKAPAAIRTNIKTSVHPYGKN